VQQYKQHQQQERSVMNITTIALAISLGITPQLATTVQQTIRGDNGNGIERIHKLGTQYDDVQRAINRYYSQQYADTTPTTQHATTTPTPTTIPTPTTRPTPTTIPTPNTTTWHEGYQPCTEEDGSGQASCYWDATTRGNHEGRSYIIKNGQTHYIN
jgi:hypothetical protein